MYLFIFGLMQLIAGIICLGVGGFQMGDENSGKDSVHYEYAVVNTSEPGVVIYAIRRKNGEGRGRWQEYAREKD